MSACLVFHLAGYLLAGALPRPGGAAIRRILAAVITAFGLLIGASGFIPSARADFSLLFLPGLGNGYIAILLITWMQIRTPQDMPGRIMSLMMLSSYGLAPLSQGLAGLLSKASLTFMFAIPGLLALGVAAGWSSARS